jgi:FkbM family methyltransferase
VPILHSFYEAILVDDGSTKDATMRQLRARFPGVTTMKLALADSAARAALRLPPLERQLVAACRNTRLRKWLGLGAIAVAYTRVLEHPELRIAEMGKYRLQVNVAEALGTAPYFFHHTGALWLTPWLIRQGDHCVDAGANVGHYTFLMAGEVGPSGLVLAFEANPAFVEILKGTVELNQYASRVRVFPLALWEESNQEKTFWISVNSANSGTSSLVNHGYYLRNDSQVSVKTVTLDDAADAAGVKHFRLVKIDVERAEEFVLSGASNMLSEHRIDFLIVELVAGSRPQDQLREHGYVGWFADVNRKRLTPIDSVQPGTFGDFVFASPRCVGELQRLVPGTTALESNLRSTSADEAALSN